MARTILKVYITTADCKEGETYQHELPAETYAVDVVKAVETLYSHLDISDIQISVEEAEEE